MSSYSSYSESDEEPSIPKRLFGRQRNMHQILGGGKVADILMWENKNLSAAILIGVTVIWFLFEVAEYNFITLLCHTSIMVMIIMFLWSTLAAFFDWSNPPDFRDITIPEEKFRWLFGKVNWWLLKLYDISSGKDFRTFFLAITFLWVLSVTGSNFSSLNLLYLGFLSLMTLPAFYEHYEDEVNHLATQGRRDLKKLYRKFDATVLSKIPRGPVRSKKTRFLF
ncbi:OLC1v1032218C1 [Oldenlandia corymbosa var. corymbosa]|uniref:Reticulon-like protein n=1 Tax=Oldenlandia corymbosa var. corymbosa TaxID=529605 RepID=A0AAV1CL84_OLDCO|nr:OLC1v1032218C1 [Oldenlandia corymbosa var. corymbosa]